MNSPTRRLRHRVPVRLRHNWKLVTVCVTFLALCWGVFGSGTIHPYVTSARSAATGLVTQNLTGTKDLFDTSVPHQVKITFRDEAYQDMLSEYFKDGDKKYVEADLTIDGTTISSVGVRLKGNSTLMGLTWKGKTRPRGGGPGGAGMPEGLKPPEGVELPEGFRPPGDGQAPGAGGPPGGGAAGPGMSLKAEEPETLPWLISFDEFVEGRRYQDRSQIAVRPAAMGSATLLNEALAISLVGRAGEPTQRYAYGAFTVNGRSSSPRLLMEYLDEGYAEDLGDGVLYKSLATSTFTYKGEDQTKYTTDYKQINRIGGKDLQPVIDLVKWVENASDQEFASGLAERLDVTSFARYLALQNLVVNFDDMSGPGRNYYLWYDMGAKRFTVISWDLNYAFSGDAKTDPNGTVGMGFGGGGPGGGTQRPGGRPRPQGQDGPQPGGGMRMSHALKDRFLKTPAFKKIYTEQYRELYRGLMADGTASQLLDSIVRSYKLNKGADTAKVEAEARTLRASVQTRAKTLRADRQIGA